MLPAYVPERLEQTDVGIEHYGYLGAVRDAKEKSRRNIELLRAQPAEGPCDRPSCISTSVPNTPAPATSTGGAGWSSRPPWRLVKQESEDGSAYEFTPSLMARLVKAMRFCGGRGAQEGDRAGR